MLKINNTENTSPSIMEPMEPLTLVKAEISDAMLPDVANVTDLKSIPFISTVCEEPYDQEQRRSFLLMDGNENLLVSTPEMFCKKIGCPESEKIKVISIFGNTGDGKSHTMNNTFFHGEEVFRTSSEQNSCTMGIWAAMQPKMGVLCLDTEGLLGATTSTCRRMRMLLKVLAISDIVIFRTRAERLHSDMFLFLGNASKAFCSHFASALQSLVLPGSAKALGPAVVIFHETKNTKPLESSVEESAEDCLRDRFSKIGSEIDAFSSLRYIGIQSEGRTTDYSKFFNAVRIEIENTAVRSPRQPGVVFKAMKALNLKFSGEIPEKQINPFPEQYFTCTVICESCGRRCERSMGHVIDGENHYSAQLCQYQHQLNNKVYLCKTCHANGREVIVSVDALTSNESSWTGLVKYAWQGSVIECPNCGEIYRSRQYWYGNKSPEDFAVRPEIIHVWKGGNITAKGPMHSAQMVIDGVSYITEAMSSITSQPAKAISNWVADQVNPSYWKPNHEIHHCHACKKNFEKTGLRKHHCRGCGEGFCNACSKYKMPVIARGWKDPVRVCNQCRQELLKKQDSTPVKIVRHSSTTAGPPSEEGDITVRKYSEAVYSTLSSVKTAIDYSKEVIKDTARPSYWIPDAEATNCALCKIPFGTADELENAKLHGMIDPNRGVIPNGDCLKHHCRACGKVVCEMCSMNRRPVPEFGWTSETRVCDACCVDKAKTD